MRMFAIICSNVRDVLFGAVQRRVIRHVATEAFERASASRIVGRDTASSLRRILFPLARPSTALPLMDTSRSPRRRADGVAQESAGGGSVSGSCAESLPTFPGREPRSRVVKVGWNYGFLRETRRNLDKAPRLG